MRGIIDSHAHICGDILYPRWEEVIAGAKEAGIEKIMIVCTGLSEAERAIEIAKKESMFDVACLFSTDISILTHSYSSKSLLISSTMVLIFRPCLQ